MYRSAWGGIAPAGGASLGQCRLPIVASNVAGGPSKSGVRASAENGPGHEQRVDRLAGDNQNGCTQSRPELNRVPHAGAGGSRFPAGSSDSNPAFSRSARGTRGDGGLGGGCPGPAASAGWRMAHPARLRREAMEVGRESVCCLDECKAALGLTRPVRLAVHPAVKSPVVVAGLCPAVLVPTDWFDWPETHRRACLLHELAHLARYDDWTKLAQEVLRVPFFFHPLVRWLFARLDLEREFLGDLAAVAQGCDPVGYARLLLELAGRPGRLVPVSFSSRHGVLPLVDRGTVRVRIERLLEEDMQSNLARSSMGRSLLIVGVAVAAALVVGGLRVGEHTPAARCRQSTCPRSFRFTAGWLMQRAHPSPAPRLSASTRQECSGRSSERKRPPMRTVSSAASFNCRAR